MVLDRRGFIGSSLAATLSINIEHNEGITAVPGVSVGHWNSSERPTGCTVALFDGNGAVAGVDVRGSAPGTRETDLLHPLNTVQRVNAILLSGGSAFGLDAASGVMRYLDEHQVGYRVGALVVPIVPAAILFDLNVGNGKIRPDAQAGYQACRNASKAKIAEGNEGAGYGATVGKMFGPQFAMKGGLGSFSAQLPGTDIVIGAMVAVNAIGDIVDHRTGELLAGARAANKSELRGTVQSLLTEKPQARQGGNSTIGLVVTNAELTKVEANKLAQMAHDGFARSINPVHTAYDGDTIFAAGTGLARQKADPVVLGSIGAECMAFAIQRAILNASSLPNYPAHRDLKKA